MQFPAQVPAVVKRAVRLYVKVSLAVSLVAAVAWGLTAALAVLETTMLVDRFWEVAPATRAAGPRLMAVVAAALGIALVALIARALKRDPLGVAILLDRANPARGDRWSTSLDVAERLAAGKRVGSDGNVERLYHDTETLTDMQGVGATVSRKPAGLALAALAVTVVVMAAMQASGALNLELLWQRFWSPYGNFARDSYTQVTIGQANGKAFGGELAPLPEGSALELSVTVTDRRPGRDASRVVPVVEIMGPGTVQVVTLHRDGTRWLYRQARLESDFAFRLRAGDGLTKIYRQEVVPRIRLTEVKHSIRYPRYAKMKPVTDQPLTAKRLSMLTESQLDMTVECDSPIKEFTATFEVLQKAAEEPKVLTNDDAFHAGRTKQKEATPETTRRPLRVRTRSETTVQFGLRVEESGILRLQAVGENGLASQPYVCVVEALPDAPPRITVTGVDLDTTIMPGEVVAFQYRAEDDLAVVDMVMNWTVAGGATVGDLSGSEYIRSDQYGQTVVTGQELIQRMNYKIYATAPFEFTLVVVDSKGQEARSPTYRIHLIDDDHAARFERGMEYLRQQNKSLNTLRMYYNESRNQLAILKTAVGDSKTWPEGQETVQNELLRRTQRLSWIWLDRDNLRQRYSGLPFRLDRSVLLVIAAERMLPGTSGIYPHVVDLPKSANVPAAIEAIDKELTAGSAMIAALQSGIQGELNRFTVESAVQRARKLAQRFGTLETTKDNRELYAANLEFYQKELAEILKALATQETLLGSHAGCVAALTEAHEAGKPEAIMPALRAMIQELSGIHPPPSQEMTAVASLVTEQAATTADGKRRFTAAVSDAMRSRAQEMILPPMEVITLGRLAEQFPPAAGPGWYYTPVTPFGMWLRLGSLRGELARMHLDVRAGRYELYPESRFDEEAALREEAIGLLEALDRTEGLAGPLAGQLKNALTPFGLVGFSAGFEQAAPPRLGGLTVAWEALGKQVKPPELKGDWARVAGRMEELSKVAAAHGVRLRAFMKANADDLAEAVKTWQPALGQEAMLLWVLLEGQEAYFRSLAFVHTRVLLTAPPNPAWPKLEEWQSMQLAMTELAMQAQDQIYGRHYADPRTVKDPAMHMAVTVTNCDRLAGDLKTYAGVLTRMAAGQPTEHDFGPLFKSTKTTGYLPGLGQEFAYLAPYLASPREALPAEKLDELLQGKLAKVVTRERMLLGTQAAKRQLGAAKDPAAATAALKRLQTVLKDLDDDEVQQTLAQAVQSVQTGDLENPTTKHRLHSVDEVLATTLSQLRSRVRLPPVNTTGRENRRFTSREGIPYLWTISALVDNYDRRWVERLREGELGLMRQLLNYAAPDGAPPATAEPLIFDYDQLLELRARNLANEQRKNRGISFLEQEGGSALNLPKHIATEFIKARNRRSPEAFAERIERYQTQLYQDMAR